MKTGINITHYLVALFLLVIVVIASFLNLKFPDHVDNQLDSSREVTSNKALSNSENRVKISLDQRQRREENTSSFNTWELVDHEYSWNEIRYEHIPLYGASENTSIHEFPLDDPAIEFEIFSNIVYGNILDRLSVDDISRTEILAELSATYRAYTQSKSADVIDLWFIPSIVMRKYLSGKQFGYFGSFQTNLLKREPELYTYLNQRYHDQISLSD